MIIKNKKKLLLSSILMITIFMVVIIYKNQCGKVEKFVNEEGNEMENSIATKEYVEVNGVKLGMIIRGKDNNNPVLLFLHGGPGMPEYFLKQDYPIKLEDYFTVVWLDQRGAGLSYRKDMDAQTITPEQFISDDIEVTKYLCERFDQDKIYLMAHSWGTEIGVRVAEEAPELYSAYIAMSQITDLRETEKLAYDYMLNYYEKNGDHKTVSKLQKVSYDSKEYEKMRGSVLHKAGIGTARDMNSEITGIFFPSLKCKEYTLTERVNLWRGRIFSMKAWKQNGCSWAENTQDIKELQVPIYFLHGLYDYTVSYDLAKEFYQQMNAPVKGFYTFEESAHSPLFEEPDKALQIMLQDVLNGTTNLADKQ